MFLNLPSLSLKASLAILLFSFSLTSYAQLHFWHSDPESSDSTRKAGDLYLDLPASFYFLNNEFFGAAVEGYTLPGYQLMPWLSYQLGDWVVLGGGLNLQQEFGENKDLAVRPLLSAQAKLRPDLQLTLGYLDAYRDHRLSDALYYYEAEISAPFEMGFRFEYEGGLTWGDAWMSWEQYIETGDTIPEIFTAGVSLRQDLWKNDRWELVLPLQGLALHRGGQVSDFEAAGTTLLNVAGGLELLRRGSRPDRHWGWFGQLLYYNDLKEAQQQGIYTGHALYSGFSLQAQSHRALLAFWQGNDFLSVRGNPIYQSISSYGEREVLGKRQLLEGRYRWEQRLHPQAVFSFLLDGFLDLETGQLDYGYSLRLSLTPAFFLGRPQGRSR